MSRALFRSPTLPLAAGLILSLGVLWYFFWPSDVRRVEKNARAFFAAVRKSGPESLPISASRSIQAGSFLAPDVQLRLGEPFPTRLGKSGFSRMLQHGRIQLDRLDIKSRGHQMQRREEAIWMDITLDVSAVYQGRSESMIGTYRFVWIKLEDQWVINAVEALDVIQHPQGMGMVF